MRSYNSLFPNWRRYGRTFLSLKTALEIRTHKKGNIRQLPPSIKGINDALRTVLQHKFGIKYSQMYYFAKRVPLVYTFIYVNQPYLIFRPMIAKRPQTSNDKQPIVSAEKQIEHQLTRNRYRDALSRLHLSPVGLLSRHLAVNWITLIRNYSRGVAPITASSFCISHQVCLKQRWTSTREDGGFQGINIKVAQNRDISEVYLKWTYRLRSPAQDQ